MEYIVALLTAAVIGLLSYATLNKNVASKLRVFKQADAEEVFTSLELPKWAPIVGAAVMALVGFATALKIQYRVSDVLGVIKMLIALVCMTGAACFDFREKRIPNIFPGVLALSGVVLLAFLM